MFRLLLLENIEAKVVQDIDVRNLTCSCLQAISSQVDKKYKCSW